MCSSSIRALTGISSSIRCKRNSERLLQSLTWRRWRNRTIICVGDFLGAHVWGSVVVDLASAKWAEKKTATPLTLEIVCLGNAMKYGCLRGIVSALMKGGHLAE